jgi:hypothetical protein
MSKYCILVKKTGANTLHVYFSYTIDSSYVVLETKLTGAQYTIVGC